MPESDSFQNLFHRTFGPGGEIIIVFIKAHSPSAQNTELIKNQRGAFIAGRHAVAPAGPGVVEPVVRGVVDLFAHRFAHDLPHLLFGHADAEFRKICPVGVDHAPHGWRENGFVPVHEGARREQRQK